MRNKTILKTIFAALLLVSCIGNIRAMDIDITGKEVEARLSGEYNRTFAAYGEISAAGSLELNNLFLFRGGASFGIARGSADINLFTKAQVTPLKNVPLGFYVSWNYSGLPVYETYSHTILPSISYNTRRVGISAGVSFMLTSFFGEKAIFESILSLSGYINFINNETLRLGIVCANFTDFRTGTMGSYSLTLASAVRITDRWTIVNDIELSQRGSIGLAAYFYGIGLKTGVNFTW